MLGISDIEPDRLIELEPASATHLPQPRNAWLDFQDSSPVPDLVSGYFVRKRRAGSDKRHFSPEYIQELRKFVQASPSQERPYPRYSRVVRKLVDASTVAITIGGIALGLAGDQLRHIFPVNAGIVIDIHRSEFQECEERTVLPYPPLPKKHGAFRRHFNCQRDNQESRRAEDKN